MTNSIADQVSNGKTANLAPVELLAAISVHFSVLWLTLWPMRGVPKREILTNFWCNNFKQLDGWLAVKINHGGAAKSDGPWWDIKPPS
jgi:hypothetical protein